MEIHIGDRIADVTLVSKEGNKVQFLIDGKPYDVDIVMAENGSCSILHDGNSFNAELIRGEGGKSYDVNMFYRSYHVDIVDTQTKYLRMNRGSAGSHEDAEQLQSKFGLCRKGYSGAGGRCRQCQSGVDNIGYHKRRLKEP